VAEVHRGEAPGAEVAGAVERPERGLERLHDVSRSPDLRRLARPERAACDLVDRGGERVLVPVAGCGREAVGEELILARAAQRADEQRGEVAARVDGLPRAVGGA